MLHIEPPVWRTLQVPDTLSQAKLDRLIQAAMSGNKSRLRAWQIQGERCGRPGLEWDAPGTLFVDRKIPDGAGFTCRCGAGMEAPSVRAARASTRRAARTSFTVQTRGGSKALAGQASLRASPW
ncbi:plasmid pRiA4b ORF-3 family protein [Zeimonas arvi]|uniref:plasmid pRiA4b ORF-3 family protein n=1 Tax=Zeimonas arvi TaxID=2498847 RepID=UPI001CECBAAC|nr:plasmid pRiA4b ORF-3 family protein [Zeimonas arvi]